MEIDLKDLKTGHIYAIDVETGANELDRLVRRKVITRDDVNVNLLPLDGVSHIVVKDKKAEGSAFVYDVMPMNADFEVVNLEGLDPKNLSAIPRLIPYGRKIKSSWPIYIDADKGLISPEAQSRIAQAELGKQKIATVRQVLTSKGVDPSLTSKIGELAGLSNVDVRPRLGGKRKTRKGNKKSKKTRRH